MIIFEVTEDKFGKLMKSVSEIGKHADCLLAMFEDFTEDHDHENRYGNRKRYDDDDFYGSRYGMRYTRR